MADGAEILAATLGGVLGGGILGLAGQEAVTRWKRPRLSLQVMDDPQFQIITPLRHDSGPGLRDVGNEALFLRALLKNLGRSTARRCRVFMISIERIAPDGSRSSSGQHEEAIPLPYSLRDGEKVIDLPQHLPQFVDLFMTRSLMIPQKIELAFGGTPLRIEPLISSRARYRVGLLAVADDAVPARISADFVWDGDWNSLRWTRQGGR